MGSLSGIATEVLPTVPRVGEFIELPNSQRFVVREATWLFGTTLQHDTVRLLVEGVCTNCGARAQEGILLCLHCRLADEETS